ncbi:Flavodoxin [Lachnospiraceae bacterium XBB1006]|nr:Flavodoxin [Lachnospiraceae bacterium XBB1006]
MKRLVVYYSLEGNTQLMAEGMARILGADLLRLEPEKAYADKGAAKFIWGGRSAVMKEKPRLKPYYVKVADYDEIIIGFPVWASTFAPPIRTFVSENKTSLKKKRIATFACQAGNGAQKAFEKLKNYMEIEDFVATEIFINPKTKPSDENVEKRDDFCRELRIME